MKQKSTKLRLFHYAKDMTVGKMSPDICSHLFLRYFTVLREGVRGRVLDKLHKTAVLSIRRIMLQNLKRMNKNVCTAVAKMIFPLAVRFSTISEHWLIMNNFRDPVGGKLLERVAFWVLEIIKCKKREKVLRGVLYRVEKCFSLAVQILGYSKFEVQNLGYPNIWTAGGKHFWTR